MAKPIRPGLKRDALRQLRTERAKEFGIAELDSGRLAFAKGYPKKVGLYGDPVNLLYRLDTPGYVRTAISRFRAAAGKYSEKAQGIVYTRIMAAAKRHGVARKFVSGDVLDEMLPARYRRGVRRGGVEFLPTGRALHFEIERAAGAAPARDAKGNLTFWATAATDGVMTKFTKSGKPEQLLAPALNSIGRDLVQRRSTMFLNHDRKLHVAKAIGYEVRPVRSSDVAAASGAKNKLRLRVMVSRNRDDVARDVEDGVLNQLSVFFGGLGRQEVYSDELKTHVRQWPDAEGYEASICGMAVDDGAAVEPESIEWAARSVDGLAQPGGDLLEIEFDVAVPLAEIAMNDAGELVARANVPLAGLDESIAERLCGTIAACGVFRGVGEAAPGSLVATRSGGSLTIDALIEAHGDADLENFTTFVLRGVARVDAVDRIAGLQFDHAEVSDCEVYRSFQEVRVDQQEEAPKTREGLIAIIQAQRAALAAMTDADVIAAARADIDAEYAALVALGGEALPHPLTEGLASWGGAAVISVPAEEADPVAPAAVATASDALPGLAPAAGPGEAATSVAVPADNVARSVLDFGMQDLWALVSSLNCKGASENFPEPLRLACRKAVILLRGALSPAGIPPEPPTMPEGVESNDGMPGATSGAGESEMVARAVVAEYAAHRTGVDAQLAGAREALARDFTAQLDAKVAAMRAEFATPDVVARSVDEVAARVAKLERLPLAPNSRAPAMPAHAEAPTPRFSNQSASNHRTGPLPGSAFADPAARS